jgi:hypothetical protein
VERTHCRLQEEFQRERNRKRIEIQMRIQE